MLYRQSVPIPFDGLQVGKASVAVRATPFNLRAFLAGIAGRGAVCSFNRNNVIFRQGEPGSTILYVLSGKVKLTIVGREGKEAVLAILGPGDFFGVRALTNERYRRTGAMALTNASVLRIGKAAMARALREEPRFVEAYVAYLSRVLSRAEASLVDHLVNSSERRLARILIQLADPDGTGRPQPVSLEIGQQTLAEMVGTTRARISSFMNKFRRLGLIDYNGHLIVRGSLRTVLRE
jgi:CRP-like cAMP-binding protein